MGINVNAQREDSAYLTAVHKYCTRLIDYYILENEIKLFSYVYFMFEGYQKLWL